MQMSECKCPNANAITNFNANANLLLLLLQYCVGVRGSGDAKDLLGSGSEQRGVRKPSELRSGKA